MNFLNHTGIARASDDSVQQRRGLARARNISEKRRTEIARYAAINGKIYPNPSSACNSLMSEMVVS